MFERTVCVCVCVFSRDFASSADLQVVATRMYNCAAELILESFGCVWSISQI